VCPTLVKTLKGSQKAFFVLNTAKFCANREKLGKGIGIEV